MKKRTLICLSILLFSSQSMAQSSDPAWLDDLTLQLQADERCEVSFYLNMRESELAGKPVHEARAQCVDGRQFDASRLSPDEDFQLNLCGTQLC